ncbi:hypothetical protein [Spiroplasma endosymbiont of Acasis viretata]|uniref:hypothetical protein n=1 Tax=Spiroplasma endosymbiont of Acasis viretata TaxID=3066306 RepID=UPI00313EA400
MASGKWQVAINEIIVQKINKLARDGKAVIIVPHNANIGVRTLPYLTIYRELNKNQNTENKTYLGNSFKETMHNIQNEETDFIWADICEKILEGGEEAFNDRSNYYGK